MTNTGDDCYFFYYSTCTKGSLCPYRHVPEALGNEVTCINWKQGFCFRPNCAFRHMDITKNRAEIVCYWESQPSGCQKPHCPFKHVKRGTGEGASMPATSTSLINKLPTITGPVTKAPPPTVVSTSTASKPSVEPAVLTLPDTSDMDVPKIPTVKPVVVTPMDSEDDESIGTMSTDGSPTKRGLVSPIRPLSRPATRPAARPETRPAARPETRPQPKDQTKPRLPVRPIKTAKTTTAQEKPLSLGIKTLAEIRRGKNKEEEDVDKEEEEVEEQMEEEQEQEQDNEAEIDLGVTDDLDAEFFEEEPKAYPPLTRRIISVSNTTQKEEKHTTNKPSNRSALVLTKRKEEAGGRSLVEIRENRIKRLGGSLKEDTRLKRLERSLEDENIERGSLNKRIKISKPVDTDSDGDPKKTILRRVVVGGGTGTKKEEADSSGLDSIKIKTVAEIKAEKLVRRLGRKRDSDDGAKDDTAVVTSLASRKMGLAERLGKVVRDFGSDDETISSKSKVKEEVSPKRTLSGRLRPNAERDEEEASQKRTLAGRLGTITRTVRTTKAEPANESTKPVGGVVRLGRAVRTDRDGDRDSHSSSGIKVKSLEQIKREKILRRLGKLPEDDGDAKRTNINRGCFAQQEDQEEEDESDSDISYGDKDNAEEEEEEEEDEEEEEESDDSEDSSSEDDDDEDDDDDDDDDDEAEEEDKDLKKVREEEKKSSGEIRIKTLAEIRLEKQRRLGAPSSIKPEETADRENGSERPKKGVQSVQERRNRKRTEMALYKPPPALRGSRENQTSGLGLRRIRMNAEEKEDKPDEDRPIKVRRLNLTKSVESVNKGTESILNVIKEKNDGNAEPVIKVKSLAEIRAEKRRLAAAGDSAVSSLAGRQETDPAEDRLKEGKVEEEEKTEEEKRRERRAKIWSRVEFDDKPEKSISTVVNKGDMTSAKEEQLRRERRARLWNVAPSGDATSRPSLRDAAPEIKIKTLDEIRREKRLREQQQKQRQPEESGDQAAISSVEFEKSDLRTDEMRVSPVNFAQARGDKLDSTPDAISEIDTKVSAQSSPKRIFRQRTTTTKAADRTDLFAEKTDASVSLVREERVGRIRRLPAKAANFETISTSVGEEAGHLDEGEPSPAAVAKPTQETPSAITSVPKLTRKPITQRLGTTSQKSVPDITFEDAAFQEPPIPQSSASLSAQSTAPSAEVDITSEDTTEGAINNEAASSSFLDDSNISLISLKTDPDSTTTEDNVVSESIKPKTMRLTSFTDDEDLHRFLAENDDDLDDSKPTISVATHDDDDDLLNELDDFLNS